MDIETAEKIVTDCQEMRDKIQEAMAATEAQRDHAEQRLGELKKDLSMTLASLALGEVTSGEVAEAKAEIAELESSISDMGLTLQGLQAREQQANNEMTKATKIVQRHKAQQRYDSIKAQLEQRYSKDLDGYLRQAAKELGHEKQAEAEVFLTEAKKRWGETLLQDR